MLQTNSRLLFKRILQRRRATTNESKAFEQSLNDIDVALVGRIESHQRQLHLSAHANTPFWLNLLVYFPLTITTLCKVDLAENSDFYRIPDFDFTSNYHIISETEKNNYGYQPLAERHWPNQRQIKVYLALLELGANKAGAVMRKAQLQNSVVHMTLSKLVDKGLATFVRYGKVNTTPQQNRKTSFASSKKRRLASNDSCPN